MVTQDAQDAADHEGLHAEAGCILKENVTPWKACMGTGFLTGLWTHGEEFMQGQVS